MSVDHYENFPVASWLCPPALRPAIRAIYAFARTADDLADEGPATAADRMRDLAAYEADLHEAAAGDTPSMRWRDVFEPLAEAIRRHDLPLPLLGDLLSAFRQDVVRDSYVDRNDLLDYCRRSANPIGRLLLHLYGITGADASCQSDAICTALQLANFWQDLSIDTRRQRLYVPLADCARHGVAPASLLAGTDSSETRALVAELVGWTRAMMIRGAPLAHRIHGRAGWELRLVVQGGLRILDKIEQRGFAVMSHRPTLRWHDAPGMVWRALARHPALHAREEPA